MAIGGAQELLTFLITANGQQAIREVNNVSKAFSRQEQVVAASNRKTAAAFATTAAKQAGIAAAAGAGVIAAAAAANDLDKSFSRLDATFGAGAASVKEWAKNANDVFLSDRQAAAYAANIGEAAQGLGLAADESARLVPEVLSVTSQLATLKGLDMDNSIESIAAALRGEFDATQKLVPALSARRIQEEALVASGKEQEKDLTTREKALATLNIILNDGQEIIAGNADALDDLGAKWAKVKTNLDDALTSFGSGALAPVEALATGMGAVAESANLSGGKILEAAGAASTVGVAAFGATAGVNALGAGALKLAERFGASESRLTSISRAFSGLSRAVGVVGALTAIGTALYELTDDAEGAQTALTEFFAATEDVTRVDKFSEALSKLDGGFEDILEIGATPFRQIGGAISELFGNEDGLREATAQYVQMEGALAGLGRIDIYDTVTALEQMGAIDPAGTLEWINLLKESLGESGPEADLFVGKLNDVAEALEARIALSDEAAAADLAESMAREAEAAGNLASEMDDAAEASKRLNDALGAFSAVTSVQDAIIAQSEATTALSEAQAALAEAEAAGDVEGAAAARLDIADAMRQQERASIDLLGQLSNLEQQGPQAIQNMKRAILQGLEGGLIDPEVATRTLALIDGMVGYAEQNPIDLQANADPANNTLQSWADRANSTEAKSYLNADEAPAQTALERWQTNANAVIAQATLDAKKDPAEQKYAEYKDKASGDIIRIPLDANDGKARTKYGSLESAITRGLIVPVDANTRAAESKISSLNGRTISLNVRTIGVNLNQLGAAGGAPGPGAVTVLPDGGIMGPGIVPLTELIGAYVRNNGGGGSPQVGTYVNSQTINLPRGADAREVEAAQRRYAARNGNLRR